LVNSAGSAIVFLTNQKDYELFNRSMERDWLALVLGLRRINPPNGWRTRGGIATAPNNGSGLFGAAQVGIMSPVP
jgi:hypothetical protein